jgi:hypothetical protein
MIDGWLPSDDRETKPNKTAHAGFINLRRGRRFLVSAASLNPEIDNCFFRPPLPSR